MNDAIQKNIIDIPHVLQTLLSKIGFSYLILISGIILFNSDNKVIGQGVQRGFSYEPTFLYTYKVLGLDIVDYLTLFLIFVTLFIILYSGKIAVTSFHRGIQIILIIYLAGLLNGYFYGFFLDYPFIKQLQSFQPVFYLIVYFYGAYILCHNLIRWNILYLVLISLVGLFNIKLLIDMLTGKTVILGEFAFTAIVGTDAAILALFFFPFLISFFVQKGKWHYKIIWGIFILTYFVVVIGNRGRTVIATFLVSSIILLYEFDWRARFKYLLSIGLSIFFVMMMLTLIFPNFITHMQGRLTSIVNFSKSTNNLSNATRAVEMQNVFHRVFAYGSPLLGMGVGAWWDDDEYQLLAGDKGSGFIGEKKYFSTHLLFVTQILEVGFIGTMIFWILMAHFFFRTRSAMIKVKNHPYYFSMILSLNLTFFSFLGSQMVNSQKLMMFIGIILALMSRITEFVEEKRIQL
ncbi:MAG: hypothetical protein B6244_05280 [Candidatus Cloacimonetes bacterium 4572_55]|nr:MAG: hypothetical protein B6244_05280 [Candidatus Cloacimonetes bacterium 4572_55]